MSTAVHHFSPCAFPNSLWRSLLLSSYVFALSLPLFLALVCCFEKFLFCFTHSPPPLLSPGHTHRHNNRKNFRKLPLKGSNITPRYRMTLWESRAADGCHPNFAPSTPNRCVLLLTQDWEHYRRISHEEGICRRENLINVPRVRTTSNSVGKKEENERTKYVRLSTDKC